MGEQQIAMQQQQMLEAQKVLLQQQQQSNLSNASSNAPSPQNEGISGSAPINPYYGNDSNTTQQAPSYPVLNKPVEPVQPVQVVQNVEVEQKQPDIVQPVMGQDAANEVLVWLTKLRMERYYNTFIENG